MWGCDSGQHLARGGQKSFKVSFNTFTQGASWNGLEKLNLNGNHNDPSMLRARMVWNSCGPKVTWRRV